MAMSEAAKAARRAYTREWKKNNRERANAAQREWRRRNPDKEREYNERYWEKKAAQNSPILNREKEQ